MLRFGVLCGIVIATGLVLGLTTEAGAEATTVLGLPVVTQFDEPAWLAVGGGIGVVVIGVGGAGVVCFGLMGAGLLFATGQVAIGGIALCQAGLGFTFFVGQGGGALVGAFGQVVGAIFAVGQGALGRSDSKEFLTQLNGELGLALSLRGGRQPEQTEGGRSAAPQ